MGDAFPRVGSGFHPAHLSGPAAPSVAANSLRRATCSIGWNRRRVNHILGTARGDARLTADLTRGTARGDARPTSNCRYFQLMAITTFEVGQFVVIGKLFGQRINDFQAARQLFELKSNVEQAGHPAPAHQCMRLPLFIPFHGDTAGDQTHFPLRQFALHFPLDSRRGQPRQLIVGLRETRLTAIGPGYKRLPSGHPTATFGAVLRLAIHHGRVKEGWGEPSEPTMGAEGATEGGERLRQVAGSMTATAQATAVQATNPAAHGRARDLAIGVMSGHLSGPVLP